MAISVEFIEINCREIHVAAVLNYVLIDLENVQPNNLSILAGHDFRVLVFVGEKQTKISFDLAVAIQGLGADSEYIKINGNGPNALDFHIAFYIGELSKSHENSYFHVISKDRGFDPLIRHLKSRKIRAQRHKDVADIPLLKVVNATSKSERVDAIVDFLIARGTAKPRKVKTLSNSINSLFMRSLDEKELVTLIDELVKRNIVVISDKTNVSYKLPS